MGIWSGKLGSSQAILEQFPDRCNGGDRFPILMNLRCDRWEVLHPRACFASLGTCFESYLPPRVPSLYCELLKSIGTCRSLELKENIFGFLKHLPKTFLSSFYSFSNSFPSSSATLSQPSSTPPSFATEIA